MNLKYKTKCWGEEVLGHYKALNIISQNDYRRFPEECFKDVLNASWLFQKSRIFVSSPGMSTKDGICDFKSENPRSLRCPMLFRGNARVKRGRYLFLMSNKLTRRNSIWLWYLLYVALNAGKFILFCLLQLHYWLLVVILTSQIPE